MSNSEVNSRVKASIEATEATLLRLQKLSIKRQTFEYGKRPSIDVPIFPGEDDTTSVSTASTTAGISLITSTAPVSSSAATSIATGTGSSASSIATSSVATTETATSTAATTTQTDASSKKKQKKHRKSKKNKRRRRRRHSEQVVNMSDSANSAGKKSASEDTAVEMDSKGGHITVASSGAKPRITVVPGTTKITPIRDVTGFIVDLNVRTEGREDMPLRVEFPGFVPKRIFDGNWRDVV